MSRFGGQCYTDARTQTIDKPMQAGLPMSLFQKRPTDYSVEQGNVRYMDGSRLLAPRRPCRAGQTDRQRRCSSVIAVVHRLPPGRRRHRRGERIRTSQKQGQRGGEPFARPVSVRPARAHAAGVTYGRPGHSRLAHRRRLHRVQPNRRRAPAALTWSSCPPMSRSLMPPPCTRRAWAAFRRSQRGAAAQRRLVAVPIDRADGLSLAVKYADFSAEHA